MADSASSSSRIYVKNLPSSLTPQDFRKHFAQQALVTDAKYIAQKRIGYVGYKSDQDAEKAVAYFDKSFMGMARIRVEIARPYSTNDDRPMKRRRLEQDASRGESSDQSLSIAGRVTEKYPYEASKGVTKPDPALLEYVQVMNPADKSNTWRNGDDDPSGLRGQLHHNADQLQTQTKPTMMPSPRAKPVDSRTTTQLSAVSSLSALPDKHDPSATQVSDALSSPQIQVHPEAGAASDVDWIRSRTSRLLGLVDDAEDGSQAASVQDVDTKPKRLHEESDIRSRTIDEELVRTDAIAETGERMIDAADEAERPRSVSARLFVRNLTYSITMSEVRDFFTDLGHGVPVEVHLPSDSRTGQNKGFAHVTFQDALTAKKVLQDADQKPLQGRIVHILPSAERQEETADDFSLSKLPLKMQQLIGQRRAAASTKFNWNSLFMNSDAVVSSVADRMGMSKSTLLDPSSSDAAVKQALAETHTIEETKNYFVSQGVDLNALTNKKRGDNSIIIKNFPYGTKVEELRALMEQHAPVAKILMPPAGTIAIAVFDQDDHSKAVFSKLAYRRFKNSLLFLEKGPMGFLTSGSVTIKAGQDKVPISEKLENVENSPPSQPFESSTLFVSNLSFSTTTQKLHDTFASLGGFRSARVKTKVDVRKPGQTLSMGFGFLEFDSTAKAEAAIGAINGYKLDGHDLIARASHKGSETGRKNQNGRSKDKNGSTKIIIKNLPFEVSKRDIRSLFGAYGKLQSVRLPKKFDNSTRGFAFANFTSAREAETAVQALGDTHLLGRRLVLEVAAEDELDPEAEIDKMQKKAGKQSDRVALQKLTGAGRHKFVMEGQGDHVDR